MTLAENRYLVTFALALTGLTLLSAPAGQATDSEIDQLKRGAERGDPEAEFALGKAYDTGKGVPLDPPKAFEYYRLSAKHGNAKAQNNLASIYATGSNGVKMNDAEARKWLRRAAEQGAALAQDNLGLILAEESDPEALRWFERAATQGLLSAQRHLGNIYYNGTNGIERDYVKAFYWLQKAAEQNDAWSQNLLGVMYQNGQGGPPDTALAMLWFGRSAEQGNAKAQSNLGQMYCLGHGVETNPVEGYKWLTLSVEQKERTAEKFLAGFASNMTPEQRAEGKRLAEEFKPKQISTRSRGEARIPALEQINQN